MNNGSGVDNGPGVKNGWWCRQWLGLRDAADYYLMQSFMWLAWSTIDFGFGTLCDIAGIGVLADRRKDSWVN